MDITTLQKGLLSLRRERQDFPPETPEEAEIYECREAIWELKIEAERRLVDLRTQYALSKKRTKTLIEGDLEITKTLTAFGWEPLDTLTRKMIAERLANGIDHYTDIINQLRDGKQLKSTTNEPATV